MPIIRLQGENERLARIYYEVDTDQPALGAGGMGQVYRGLRIDQNTGVKREVAIKFLFDDLPASAIERSRREANIQISNENLVEMFGFIEVQDKATGVTHYHVVSELLQGVMLYDLLQGTTTDKNGQPVEFAEQLYGLYRENRRDFAIKIVKAVLSGVMAMHDRGFIHRDIDPSNIMVTREGRIKLIDYGIAKNLNDSQSGQMVLTSTGQFMGKAAYAAPELVTGDVAHQNETTDIYAIGIMLFQLLTGHLPFEGANHEVLEMHLKKPLPLKDIADAELRAIVNRATRKKQSERYITASEFRVDLEHVERGARTSAGRITPFSANDGTGHKKLYIIISIICIVGLLAFVGGAVALFNQSDDGTDGETADSTHFEQQKSLNNRTAQTSPLENALALLSESQSVPSAIDELQKLADGKSSEAADAAAYLAYVYGYRDMLRDKQRMALESAGIAENKSKAYSYANQAYTTDPDNVNAVFIMAVMYAGGPSATDGALERDMNKALEMFEQARELAKKSGNNKIESKCNAYIEGYKEYVTEEVATTEAQAPAVEAKYGPADKDKYGPAVEDK